MNPLPIIFGKLFQTPPWILDPCVSMAGDLRRLLNWRASEVPHLTTKFTQQKPKTEKNFRKTKLQKLQTLEGGGKVWILIHLQPFLSAILSRIAYSETKKFTKSCGNCEALKYQPSQHVKSLCYVVVPPWSKM